MQKSIQYIFDRFPLIEKKIKDESVPLKTNKEQLFYQLALFMEDPKNYLFNISSLYQHLEDDDLEFALEIITNFFYNDTYLIKNKTNYIMKENRIKEGQLFNQKMFADFLTENGFNYSPQKISVYRKRSQDNIGKINFPKGDLIIGNKAYWFKVTVEQFLIHLQKG